ncbi:ATP-binding protein [Streptomyces tendae]|uniref:ATP-binding protein n=1 Tax=Streptomyces tendae TaxID=1932 RepID=UPI00379D441D
MSISSRSEPAASGSGGTGRLVGRDRDATALKGLLAENRLVTVTGGAGVGKSCLAAAVVASMVPAGVWEYLVCVRARSGGAAEHGALLAELARTLPGCGPGRGPVTLQHVVRNFPPGRTLLVVDDADPVRAESAWLVRHLLMAVSTVRVLVTSRGALGLGDEHVLRLAPLRVEARATDPDGLTPAVELFLDRVDAVGGDFRTRDPGLGHARSICRLVEGVPLALELAAEQVAHCSPGELAERLERQQGWLHSPQRALHRHRSLRAATGAGYALCDTTLRTVWARASIFCGSFGEGPAVSMCAGGDVPPHRVPGALAELAAMGVLERSGEYGGVRPVRYRMARATREFGVERLQESGEFPRAAERRVSHCRTMAEAAKNLWDSGAQTQAVALAEDGLGDLSATVSHAVERRERIGTVLETVTSLWFLWVAYDRGEEGRGHLLRLLPLASEDHRTALHGYLLAAWLTAGGDPEAARGLLGRAWPAAVLAGDDAALGRIAHVQGRIVLGQQGPKAAAPHFREAADTIPPGAPGGPSSAVSRAALAVAQSDFDPSAARHSCRRALTESHRYGDAWATLVARHARAVVDDRLGRSGRAWHRARRALASVAARPAAPAVAAALRELIRDIETRPPARPPRPTAAAPKGDATAPRDPAARLPPRPWPARPETAPLW